MKTSVWPLQNDSPLADVPPRIDALPARTRGRFRPQPRLRCFASRGKATLAPALSSICWKTSRLPIRLPHSLLAKFQCAGRVTWQRRAPLGTPRTQYLAPSRKPSVASRSDAEAFAGQDVSDQFADFAIVVHDQDLRCRVHCQITGDRRRAPDSKYVAGCVKSPLWHILQQFRAPETMPGDRCGPCFAQRGQLHRCEIGTNTMDGEIQVALTGRTRMLVASRRVMPENVRLPA
jgi:hypothetical protein